MTAAIAVFSSLHAMLIAVLIAAALPSASSSCGFESMNKLCGKSCEPKEWCEMYNGASSECERAYIRAIDTNRGESVGIYRCGFDDAAAPASRPIRNRRNRARRGGMPPTIAGPHRFALPSSQNFLVSK